MKKLSIICALTLCLALMAPGVFAAVEYGKDFSAAPANAPNSPKDFDENTPKNTTIGLTVPAYTMSPGDTAKIDVYCRNIPTDLVGAGFWLDYDNVAVTITGVAIYDGGTGGTGYSSLAVPYTPFWDPTMSGLVTIDADSFFVQVGTTTQVSPDAGGDVVMARISFTLNSAGYTAMRFHVIGGGVNSVVAVDPPGTVYDVEIVENVVSILGQVECTVDGDCNDGLWCTLARTCVANKCMPPALVGRCDDADDCTLNTCAELMPACGKKCAISALPCQKKADCPAGPGDTCTAGTDCEAMPGTCSYPCDAAGLSGPMDPCCSTAPCSVEAICQAEGILEPGDVYYNPDLGGGVTIKKPVCLDNPEVLVGGIQFDLCEYAMDMVTPVNCMECIDCELTERTTMFDCVVLELPNGCCRVILFCKNPGCAINPGLCDIVTIVYLTLPASMDCPMGDSCIIQFPENIVASDYDGYQLSISGMPGTVCPFACGDVCPPDNPMIPGWDCGDGKVDIFDILCEVDFALSLTTPDDCQAIRANVPTGTPPYCIDPSSELNPINILDIMVLIDMALNRQDCCSWYYLGLMY